LRASAFHQLAEDGGGEWNIKKRPVAEPLLIFP